VEEHGHANTPEVREQIRGLLRDERAGSAGA
jgi:hypothetical protein